MLEQRDFSFIYKYFIAEKQESLLFLVIGLVAILVSVVFWSFIKTSPSFFKGAAIPLLAIGIIQSVAGYTIYTRTDKQKADIAYNIGIEPVSFVKQKELPRIKIVMKNFVIYRWIEIAFIVAGLALIFLYRSNPDRSFWFGLGITLAIQATLMLGADYFAEKRGGIYTEELQKIVE